jgi:hypothetical protein
MFAFIPKPLTRAWTCFGDPQASRPSEWHAVVDLRLPLVEWIVIFVGGFRGPRRVGGRCAVSVIGRGIENPHLTRHHLHGRSLLAQGIFPFSGLQPAFEVHMPAALKILAGHSGRRPTASLQRRPAH